mgnify:CR=1 FL=1
MKEFKYVIKDNEGIHARPAGELVKLAKSFESSVMIEKRRKRKLTVRRSSALWDLVQRKTMK